MRISDWSSDVCSSDLKLSPQQGWHVYWSNPGDSGMPPRITWSLPPKVKISDLRHPAPVAKDAAGFVSYVHPGDVSLLADLRIPASIPTGTTLPLVANVQWLTCSKNMRSEEHTSELQSLMRTSYAVFCLKKKII